MPRVYSLIKRNREKLTRELIGTPNWWFWSPASYSQYLDLLPRLLVFAKGDWLDVGAGRVPFRKQLVGRVKTYHSLDTKPFEGTFYVEDAQKMGSVPSGRYDVVISFQVIEHLPEPEKALKEMFRVLKLGGRLIITTPHLSRIHDLPNDYYRFTGQGIAYLVKKAGFSSIEVLTSGGLLSFLGHQWSTIFLGMVWTVPVVRKVAFFLNRWLVVIPAYHLDRFFGTEKLFPLNIICLAKKAN